MFAFQCLLASFLRTPRRKIVQPSFIRVSVDALNLQGARRRRDMHRELTLFRMALVQSPAAIRFRCYISLVLRLRLPQLPHSANLFDYAPNLRNSSRAGICMQAKLRHQTITELRTTSRFSTLATLPFCRCAFSLIVLLVNLPEPTPETAKCELQVGQALKSQLTHA
jgi:hypothetical protein